MAARCGKNRETIGAFRRFINQQEKAIYASILVGVSLKIGDLRWPLAG